MCALQTWRIIRLSAIYIVNLLRLYLTLKRCQNKQTSMCLKKCNICLVCWASLSVRFTAKDGDHAGARKRKWTESGLARIPFWHLVWSINVHWSQRSMKMLGGPRLISAALVALPFCQDLVFGFLIGSDQKQVFRRAFRRDGVVEKLEQSNHTCLTLPALQHTVHPKHSVLKHFNHGLLGLFS